jgi:hypothetical protein
MPMKRVLTLVVKTPVKTLAIETPIEMVFPIFTPLAEF